jgi:hypothetical protein
MHDVQKSYFHTIDDWLYFDVGFYAAALISYIFRQCSLTDTTPPSCRFRYHYRPTYLLPGASLCCGLII